MLLVGTIDPHSRPLDVTMAAGIFLMGTGLGALLTKVALAGQIRKLRDEITDRLKAFNKASEEDDVKQPDIAHAASDR